MIFTVEFRGLDTVFRKLAGLQSVFRSEAVWSEIGHLIRAEILKRTARGVDADGLKFDGYSAGYRLYRKKHGRPVQKVNLFWTGTMLSSMDVAPLPRGGVRLYFQPTQAPDYPTGPRAKKPRVSPKSPAKAYYLQTHKTKPRKFFAVSKQDVKQVHQFLVDVLKAHLKG
jgi:hypothetical protein